MAEPIYVEIEIRADLERVWWLTQEAALHADAPATLEPLEAP
ncbi:hypothetical protein PYV02_04060 [Leifsonia sp. H3M29-4]|nr:hypothetical protein [Salinibacterium metalliresistens]MDF1478250.1 hypothetical protein [Salinibacterium metalliresistens]